MNSGFVYEASALWLQDNIRVANVMSLTPPAIVATIGNYKTTWMDMAIPVDTGMEPMQSEFKVGADMDTLALFGFIPSGKARAQFRRVYRDVSTNTEHTFVDELEGIIGSITPDENGTDSKETVGTAIVMNLSYYKLTVDGKEVYEIDPMNLIRRVNGVNVLEDRKNALLM